MLKLKYVGSVPSIAAVDIVRVVLRSALYCAPGEYPNEWEAVVTEVTEGGIWLSNGTEKEEFLAWCEVEAIRLLH